MVNHICLLIQVSSSVNTEAFPSTSHRYLRNMGALGENISSTDFIAKKENSTQVQKKETTKGTLTFVYLKDHRTTYFLPCAATELTNQDYVHHSWQGIHNRYSKSKAKDKLPVKAIKSGLSASIILRRNRVVLRSEHWSNSATNTSLHRVILPIP